MLGDPEKKKQWVTDKLEPYAMSGKQPGKRESYKPETSVNIRRARTNSGTRSNGVFWTVADFVEKEGRVPTQDELSRLSDWLDVGEEEDCDGVRLPDPDSHVPIGPNSIRLTITIGASVETNTKVGSTKV